MFHINAENTSTFLLLRCSLTLKSHYALCFCFQSFWPSCVRRRASSVSLTTTSWERRSTRRRDFVFPECSCRASSQSWANHRAHDVIWPISCHYTNFKRSWETEDWNVCLILNRGKSNIFFRAVDDLPKRACGFHPAGFESFRSWARCCSSANDTDVLWCGTL